MESSIIALLALIIAVPGATLSILLLHDRWKQQTKKPDQSSQQK